MLSNDQVHIYDMAEVRFELQSVWPPNISHILPLIKQLTCPWQLENLTWLKGCYSEVKSNGVGIV